MRLRPPRPRAAGTTVLILFLIGFSRGAHAQTADRCLPLARADAETARLWAQAREALEAVILTESDGVEFRGVTYQRLLLPGSLQIVESAEAPWSGAAGRGQHDVPSAERLARTGYVYQSDDGYLVYHAPGARILLSDVFLDGHCFSMAASGPDEHALVGLAFEPLGRSDLPGVRGVLWLDRATAELRRLDFSYTHVPDMPAAVWSAAGGWFEFERLDAGGWIASRWQLRMPEVEVRPGQGRRSPPETELVAIHETGGEVHAIVTADGRAVRLDSPGADLYGTVTDSITGEPLAGARVALLPTGRTAITDGDGTFHMAGLVAGVFGVEIQHPELDLGGLLAEFRDVTIEAGRSSQIIVLMRPVPELVAELCTGSGGWSAGTGQGAVLLHGRVLTPAGDPAADALVRVTGGALPAGSMRQIVADEDGAYGVCLDPATVPATVSAVTADGMARGAAGMLKHVTLAAPGAVRADLRLAGRAAESAIVAEAEVVTGPWQNAIVGTVFDHETRAPIGGALIRLIDARDETVHSAVTDGAGRFRVGHPNRGDVYRVTIEHLGYATAESGIHFDRHTQLRMGVALSTRAIELAPIVVSAQRGGRLADVGFHQRRARGFGTFVEVDDMLRGRASRLTDYLRGQNFVQVFQVNDFGDEDIGFPSAVCSPPAIYLDGALMRQGGTRSNVILSEIVPAGAVAAVEVYRRPSQLPPRFGGANSMCGVILVWTR